MRMLPAPIWPLAQHATFGQNCFDVSIGSAVLFCIHTTCQRTSSFSSISPFFTTYWGCTNVISSPTLYFNTDVAGFNLIVLSAHTILLLFNIELRRTLTSFNGFPSFPSINLSL